MRGVTTVRTYLVRTTIQYEDVLKTNNLLDKITLVHDMMYEQSNEAIYTPEEEFIVQFGICMDDTLR